MPRSYNPVPERWAGENAQPSADQNSDFTVSGGSSGPRDRRPSCRAGDEPVKRLVYGEVGALFDQPTFPFPP